MVAALRLFHFLLGGEEIPHAHRTQAPGFCPAQGLGWQLCECCLQQGQGEGPACQHTVEKMVIPAVKFSQVHMDIVGPLPASHEGYTQYPHLLTMIDRSTRWLEAVLLRQMTMEAVVDAFVAT